MSDRLVFFLLESNMKRNKLGFSFGEKRKKLGLGFSFGKLYLVC